MKLVITTNATLTPKFNDKDIFDYIPLFKECQINVSVEFWGDKNNYMRFPSKWETIMSNVKKVSKMPRTRILFATTVNSLNIGYLNEVAIGVDSLKREIGQTVVPGKSKSTDLYCDFATGSLVWGIGNLYCVSAIPLDIREKYIDKYYDPEQSPVRHHQTFYKLVSYLETMPFDEEMHKKMMMDVQTRDKYRGTCLTDIFPEWIPYYEKL